MEKALGRAARYGSYDIVRKVLDAGADVDAADGFGFAALQEASYRASLEVVNALLAAGADVHHETHAQEYGLNHDSYPWIMVPGGRWTALDLAYFMQHTERSWPHSEVRNRLINASARLDPDLQAIARSSDDWDSS
ncbi:hypothetical protein Micbo1qcDRAFT_203502 [Microdochium bolleyi]|uniref:Uncharacterized protein n=1 Tax=Microdochium bolleyi TaxID=196109 RepID=A0A136J8D7_9PEZI|nr:hypothetical protein Micbo1qcDRAFT_203502 [Microdochium bolleyi]